MVEDSTHWHWEKKGTYRTIALVSCPYQWSNWRRQGSYWRLHWKKQRKKQGTCRTTALIDGFIERARAIYECGSMRASASRLLRESCKTMLLCECSSINAAASCDVNAAACNALHAAACLWLHGGMRALAGHECCCVRAAKQYVDVAAWVLRGKAALRTICWSWWSINIYETFGRKKIAVSLWNVVSVPCSETGPKLRTSCFVGPWL